MSDDTTLEVKGLDKLLKALKAKPPLARIGILGSASRGDGASNATVGAAHEFGTSKLPVRSFLRMPLTKFLNKRLEESGALDKDTMTQVLASGSLVAWLKKVVLVGEQVIDEAFSSDGFGEWEPSNMKGKTNHATLVETGQLRDSITSEVQEG
jgi:hypothetical protein